MSEETYSTSKAPSPATIIQVRSFRTGTWKCSKTTISVEDLKAFKEIVTFLDPTARLTYETKEDT